MLKPAAEAECGGVVEALRRSPQSGECNAIGQCDGGNLHQGDVSPGKGLHVFGSAPGSRHVNVDECVRIAEEMRAGQHRAGAEENPRAITVARVQPRNEVGTHAHRVYRRGMTSFSDADYAHRIEHAQQELDKAGLAGVILGPGTQLAYLTGLDIDSHERLSALVIPSQGAPRLVLPATDAASVTTDLEVLTWRDGDDPYRICGDIIGAGTVGLGTALTADHVLRLQAVTESTVLAESALSALFMAKEAAELVELTRAAEAIDRVHARVPELLVPGRTEAEIAGELEKLIAAEHAAVDFVIVGSGPNGANPHHSYSERVLDNGDPVVVDLGGTLDSGYHSDCTRTHVVGGAAQLGDEEYRRAYEVLKRAFDAAIDTVRPGVSAHDIDDAARRLITEAGYGEYFFHRTGHGIGLDGHEAPYIIAGNDQIIEEGMAFSIEPGIYLPGRWGMRIEDIVTVTADGCRQLNTEPRQLR